MEYAVGVMVDVWSRLWIGYVNCIGVVVFAGS